MRPCPKCKTATLAPLADAPSAGSEVPTSRCTQCHGVWLPHGALARHLSPPLPEAEHAAPEADRIPGFCPQCRNLLVRAQVDGQPPFHLDRCPVCGGIWFDAGEWALVAESEWLTHLDDLWDPAWRRRVREQRAHERHLHDIERALGAKTLGCLRAAVDALRDHPQRALGLSFLIEQLRGPG